MTTQPETLSPDQTAASLDGSAFVHFDGVLHASFRTADFASASELVARVAQAADELNHHPDVRLEYGRVGFQLSSHDAGGVTDRDLGLADRIQRIADSLGAEGLPIRPSRYEIAIDTVDADAIRDFWRVGLGYEERSPEGEIELVDPRGNGPTVWFQRMDPPRTDRNRIHIDSYVPAEDAELRVQAIVDAGGQLLTSEHAPSWWVLADVEGNELCVCTSSK